MVKIDGRIKGLKVISPLHYLSGLQKIKYFLLVGVKSLAAIADIVGILLVGLITARAMSNIAGAGANTKSQLINIIDVDSILPSSIPSLTFLTLCIFSIKSLFAAWTTLQLANLIAKIELQNAEKIAEQLFPGNLIKLNRHAKSDFQTAILQSSSAAFSEYLSTYSTIISEGFLLVLVGITLLVTDTLAAIFTLAYFLVLAFAIQRITGTAFAKHGNDFMQEHLKTTDYIEDSYIANREIYSLGRKQYFLNKITESRKRISEAKARITFLNAVPRYLIETALVLGVSLLAFLQSRSGNVVDGAVTMGVFLVGGLRLVAALMPLQSALGLRKLYLSQAQVALAFLEEDKIDLKIGNGSNQRKGKRNKEIALAAINVSFVHPSSQAAILKKLNIEIKPNTLNAIIGPSGTGKTTLFELFLGMLSPTTGSIEIEGLPPKEFIKKYPGKVGYVPQQPALIKGTILENVALGLNTQDVNMSKLNSSLDKAGLRQFLESLPEGLNTNIGERAHLLSGGQRQRIGLARALYSQPQFLLLDEATSALDAESEAAISNTIQRLRSEMTVVLIAHRLTTVQDADMVFAMYDGEIIGKGKFRDLVMEVPMVSNYVKLGRIRAS